MAHKYYCTYCARELDQDNVLIDMNKALMVSSEDGSGKEQGKDNQRFQMIKFRVTTAEFQELLDRGTAWDVGCKRFDLSIEELAGYMANEHNLNNPAIAALTLRDIDDYLEHLRKNEFGAEQYGVGDVTSFSTGRNRFSDSFAESQEDAEEEYAASAAISALKDSFVNMMGDTMVELVLKEELSLLRKLVEQNGLIPFIIKPRYDKADTGDDILIGYMAIRRKKRNSVDTRCCPYCDTPVFEHAGAAVHRAVAFIGEPASGKTSAILALTSYARCNIANGVMPEDEIWVGSSGIPDIMNMVLLDKKGVLLEDLELYEHGVAPKKNDARKTEDAYSSTLWIENSAGRKFILTLIDLPGELCRPDGSIQGDTILNQFPVAMASDVFVVCFDTTRVIGASAAETVNRTCSWASAFQRLRQDYKQGTVDRGLGGIGQEPDRECVAPMIVLFTKCKELESGAPEMRQVQTHFNPRPVDEIYSLKDEREFIDRNRIYQEVGRKIRVHENLKDAYVARLRTSPYGFAAPQKPLYLQNESCNKKPDGTIRYPRPKHVEELMKWLLGIIGCIPIKAEFCPDPMEPERVYRLRDYYVKRPQYRVWAPQGRDKKEKQDEAMSRAYLFENYTETDEEYINNVFERPTVFEQPVMSPWRWNWPKKKRNS